MHHWDYNIIWSEALKKRAAGDIAKAYQNLMTKFIANDFKPNLFIFDNEFSEDFKIALQDNNIKLQLVTPHMHHNNPAEGAIQTLKDHL